MITKGQLGHHEIKRKIECYLFCSMELEILDIYLAHSTNAT